MSYDERIKSLTPVRQYVRDFFVRGYMNRDDFPEMKRNYYYMLQRVKSWMEDYIIDSTKNAIIIESRSEQENPLYQVFRTKSFKNDDLLLHFFLIDFLQDGPMLATDLYWEMLYDKLYNLYSLTTKNKKESENDDKTDVLSERTMKEKCKEYVKLGIFRKEKKGQYVEYKLSSPLPLTGAADALIFASETMPVGVLGFFLHHKTTPSDLPLTFKHRYLFQAPDGEIAYTLLSAIREKKVVKIKIAKEKETQTISPAKLYISRESGREHVLCTEKESPYFLRLDEIEAAKLTTDSVKTEIPNIVSHVWGVSNPENMQHVKMTVRINPGEEYILRRLIREKRCGTVSRENENLLVYEANIANPREMIPWLRTFIGRIARLESDCNLPELFEKDLDDMLHQENTLPTPSEKKESHTESLTKKISEKDSDHFIFHEIHSAYFRIIEKLLTKAAEAPVSKNDLEALITEDGFGETKLSPSLKFKNLDINGGKWPLLKDGKSILKHKPPTLFTDPERRFLKSCLVDPRVTLFLSEETYAKLSDALSDISPLWTSEDIVYYDRYNDGDPFTDENYRARFRTLLAAMREKKKVHISYCSRNDGNQKEYTGSLLSLEYSPKNDVFRFRFYVNTSPMTILVSGVLEASVTDEPAEEVTDKPETKTVVVELIDERNNLDRAMRSFSDLKKETEKLGDNRYRITLYYEIADEAEILIRILSFGSFLRVLSPDDLREKWEDRIWKQIELFKEKTAK